LQAREIGKQKIVGLAGGAPLEVGVRGVGLVVAAAHHVPRLAKGVAAHEEGGLAGGARDLLG